MQRSLLSILVLLLAVNHGISQERWQVSLDYFPNFAKETYRNTLENNPDADWRLSQTAGIAVTRIFNDRLALTSGVRYANTGSIIFSEQLRWGSQHDGTGGFDPATDSGETKVEITDVFQHLEVPLFIRFYAIDGEQIRIHCSVGPIARVLLNYQERFAQSSPDEVVTLPNDTDFDTFSFGWGGTVGVEAQISSRLFLSTGPSIQQNFLSGFNDENNIRSNYLAMGWTLQVGMFIN